MRDEKAWALWRGCTPNVVRAMGVTATQLLTYDAAKEQLRPLFGQDEESDGDGHGSGDRMVCEMPVLAAAVQQSFICCLFASHSPCSFVCSRLLHGSTSV